MIIFLFFYFYRKDSISEAVDEVIDEINASDEEITEKARKPLKRNLKSKKKCEDDLIKLMKSSISIGNESNPANNFNFENFNEAKRAIVSISNELEFHQKQTLKYAIQAGECLYEIQELCSINSKIFKEFLIECNIKCSKSYAQFLISLYNFTKYYPKICKISLTSFYEEKFQKDKVSYHIF